VSVYCSTKAQPIPYVILTGSPIYCAVELFEASYSVCPWQVVSQEASGRNRSLLPVSICTVHNVINSDDCGNPNSGITRECTAGCTDGDRPIPHARRKTKGLAANVAAHVVRMLHFRCEGVGFTGIALESIESALDFPKAQTLN